MTDSTKALLIQWADKYNDIQYFTEDPIVFPRHFAEKFRRGECSRADVEIAGVVAAHLAWGRRSMIVRDCRRALDEMGWKPYDYVMRGEWRRDPGSLHRTVKWSEFAAICSRLRDFYSGHDSSFSLEEALEGKASNCPSPTLESLSAKDFRTAVYAQKPDPKAPDKKINMLRRWMTRDDGKVDLGIWKNTDKRSLIIPLDVHVYEVATALGLTSRRQKDLATALEITDAFRDIFPDDPCLGDFALFGYGITGGNAE